MFKYLVLTFLAFLSFISQAENLINDERVTNQKTCFTSQFTSYERWRNYMEKGKKKRIKSKERLVKQMAFFDSMFKDKFSQFKENLSCNTFTYQVDGNQVQGYVIKPKTSTKKLPVLIYNRGGNGSYGSLVFGYKMHNLFPIANEGFVIIGSQYRGSLSKQDNLDEFGGKDVKDVTALLDYIPSIESADPQRIGMYGHSRGGMQTYIVAKQIDNIKAIVSIAGISDLSLTIANRPEMERMLKHRIPNYDKNKVEELAKRSAVNWPNELSPLVPILLLHGNNDKHVNVKHSIVFADALAKHEIPHKLVLYPEDNHRLSANKDKANQELVSWFKKYL